MRTLTLALSALLFIGAGAGTAAYYLRGNHVEEQKSAGTGWEIDERTLLADYVKLSFIPMEDPTLAFTMWVPKGWEARPLEVHPESLAMAKYFQVPLAEIGPPDSDDVLLSVGYWRTPPHLTVKKLLSDVVRSEAYDYRMQETNIAELQKRRKVLSEDSRGIGNEQVAETAVEFKNEQLGLMVGWYHGLRRDDRMLVIEGACPSTKYARFAQAFQVAGRTFTFTSPLKAAK